MSIHYVRSITTSHDGHGNARTSLISPIGGVVSHVRAVDDLFLAFAGRGRRPEHAPPLVGVGVTEDDALRRALGLYAASSWEAPAMQWASADELGDEALPVEELARTAPLETRDRIRWIEGFALDDGRPIWVPSILVYLGLPVAVEAEAFWPASLAGLAVEQDLGGAVLAGLLDLVARDALAVASTREAPLPRISSATDQTAVFDATTDVGIPTALAHGSTSFEVGVGAAATIETAQGFALADLVRRRGRRARETYPEEPAPDPTFEPGGSNGEALPPLQAEPVDLSKPALVARLRRVGLAGYAIDLTTDELKRAGLCAVRVVVPGLSPLPPKPGWTDHARLARVAP
ncbi:MAG TPA: YcaO-like family protein [Acidimicrobiales bacterium]|nr:YcaO-like family protein [Acidimicrobiales bacterium]